MCIFSLVKFFLELLSFLIKYNSNELLLGSILLLVHTKTHCEHTHTHTHTTRRDAYTFEKEEKKMMMMKSSGVVFGQHRRHFLDDVCV